MQSSTAKLIELFGNQLTPASEMKPGRFAAFKRIASQQGHFVPSDVTAQYGIYFSVPEDIKEELATAEDLYREATEAQRATLDDLLERYPGKSAFQALMDALWTDSRGETTSAFELTALLYDEINAAGQECRNNAHAVIAGTPTELLSVDSETLNTYRAVFKVAARCAFDNSLSEYRVALDGSEMVNPSIHVGNGLMWGLRKEQGEVIAAHPDKADLLSTAMSRSKRMLHASELELVASGMQPVPLVEGLL